MNIHFSDIIAIVALSISLFTFYWTSIRKRKDLFLTRIDVLSTYMYPEFALVNASSDDILITSILCLFIDKGGKSRSIPSQKIITNNNQSYLIQAGKSLHCKVEFVEPFDEKFINEGKYVKSGTLELYHRIMEVHIEWLDADGNDHSKDSPILEYGFNLNGDMQMRKPLQKKHNLYK